MKKVLITGGAGFIGSHTAVELCAAGYQPVVLDHFGASNPAIVGRVEEITGKALEVHRVDCRDREAVARILRLGKPWHGVIHFAAHKSVAASAGEALAYYDNNVGSLISLLHAMAEVGVPDLVYSSSATVYGEADSLPVTEQSPLKPAESPYGRTKQVCEYVLGDVAGSKHEFKVVTLRYFNPVGAHPSGRIGELPLGRPENLVPFITQTGMGLREELVVFGNDYPTRDGSCTRDFIHVVDLAKAHIAALDWLATEARRSFNEVFNVGTGRSTSVLEAIAAFEKVANMRLKYRIGERRPGDIVESYANVDRAQEVLGWKASLSIEDALRDAWHWQQALAKDPL